jgi:hypothetical protein
MDFPIVTSILRKFHIRLSLWQTQTNMVEKRTKLTKSGVLYVPLDIRTSFGRNMKILASAKAALFYPENADYEDVLKSLAVIRADLLCRISSEN